MRKNKMRNHSRNHVCQRANYVNYVPSCYCKFLTSLYSERGSRSRYSFQNFSGGSTALISIKQTKEAIDARLKNIMEKLRSSLMEPELERKLSCFSTLPKIQVNS